MKNLNGALFAEFSRAKKHFILIYLIYSVTNDLIN